MKWLYIAAAYFLIGAGCAWWRAYLDPWMVTRGMVTDNFRGTRSMFFGEAVFFHFVVWPVMLVATALSLATEKARQRGLRALARAQELRIQRERDAEEVERIIREAKL